MKKSEIINKYAQCDITINSREAKRLLIDLNSIKTIKSPMPETNILIKYLIELGDTDNQIKMSHTIDITEKECKHRSIVILNPFTRFAKCNNCGFCKTIDSFIDESKERYDKIEMTNGK